ncbi:unnamed protein product [Cercopithifilaria johnstoni]|uniref:Uncharacterized protein n=1 Tax=Cercopithifilaria johnstoni TaxID=2874296 RepID=A0A8J2M1J4_9BILA|nr:unnamed protein product [Cercopithifilaria johnstoni]
MCMDVFMWALKGTVDSLESAVMPSFRELLVALVKRYKQLNSVRLVTWRIIWYTENGMNTDDGLHARGAIHMGIASLLHISPWYSSHTFLSRAIASPQALHSWSTTRCRGATLSLLPCQTSSSPSLCCHLCRYLSPTCTKVKRWIRNLQIWNGGLPGGSVVSWLSAFRTTAIITAVLCFVEAFRFRILLLKRSERSMDILLVNDPLKFEVDSKNAALDRWHRFYWDACRDNRLPSPWRTDVHELCRKDKNDGEIGEHGFQEHLAPVLMDRTVRAHCRDAVQAA